MGIIDDVVALAALWRSGALSDAQFSKAKAVLIAESKAASALPLLAASVAPSPARWPQTRLPANQFPYDHALRMSQTTTSVLPFDIVSRIIKEADGGRYAAKQKMDKVLVDLLKWRAAVTQAPSPSANRVRRASSLPSPSWERVVRSRGPISDVGEPGSDEWYQVYLEMDERAAIFNQARTYDTRNMTTLAVYLEWDPLRTDLDRDVSSRNFSEAFQAVVDDLEGEFEPGDIDFLPEEEYGNAWEFRNQDLGVAEHCLELDEW